MGDSILLAAQRSREAEELRRALTALQIAVTPVFTGAEALATHRRLQPDVVVLGLDLPDIHGLDLCRRLRRETDVPLIVVSEDASERERVLALELGADDVVAGCCDLDELCERVRIALSRWRGGQRSDPATHTLDFGHIVIDRRAHLVRIGERCEQLTPTEVALLWALAERPGEVVTSGELLREVWGYPEGVRTRTLDVHIGRLRRKLGEDGREPRIIVTVRSVGYRFDPPGG